MLPTLVGYTHLMPGLCMNAWIDSPQTWTTCMRRGSGDGVNGKEPRNCRCIARLALNRIPFARVQNGLQQPTASPNCRGIPIFGAAWEIGLITLLLLRSKAFLRSFSRSGSELSRRPTLR